MEKKFTRDLVWERIQATLTPKNMMFLFPLSLLFCNLWQISQAATYLFPIYFLKWRHGSKSYSPRKVQYWCSFQSHGYLSCNKFHRGNNLPPERANREQTIGHKQHIDSCFSWKYNHLINTRSWSQIYSSRGFKEPGTKHPPLQLDPGLFDGSTPDLKGWQRNFRHADP